MSRMLMVVAAVLLEGMAARADIAESMQELSRLRAEQKYILQQLNANLALKRQNEAKYVELQPEDARLVAESDAIEAERPSVDALCHRTVPRGESLEEARRRCDAVMEPFNSRARRYRQDARRHKEQLRQVDESEDGRVAEAKALNGRFDRNQDRITQLTRILSVEEHGDCVIERHCKDLNGEDAIRCLMSCWDGARFRP